MLMHTLLLQELKELVVKKPELWRFGTEDSEEEDVHTQT